MVYIAEVHVQDEWPISSGRYTADGCPLQVDQPTMVAQRIHAALTFKELYGIAPPVLIGPSPPPSEVDAGDGARGCVCAMASSVLLMSAVGSCSAYNRRRRG